MKTLIPCLDEGGAMGIGFFFFFLVDVDEFIGIASGGS